MSNRASTSYSCKICNKVFASLSKLKHHKIDHVAYVLHGPDNISLVKSDVGFMCPFCEKLLKNARTIKEHINNHDGTSCSYELSDTPSSSQIESEVMDCNSCVIASSDGLLLPQNEQRLRLKLADVGNWMPILYTAPGQNAKPLLTCENIAEELLKDSTTWQLPKAIDYNDDVHNPSPSISLQLSALIKKSPYQKYLSARNYQELTGSTADIANSDWIINPNTPHFLARLFCGSILINPTGALMVNCVEAYGRTKSADEHSVACALAKT
ncbi:hypothetical protein DM01DRAFT_1408524 [Hesseltinella vesiculosa]|uniref:C2H2-type domain-containing protein n=1 Tax=Hesseltinella vesiculosa TaxID=101127 RepID=A0A1X2GDV0_9FUNG|nr:hypothetical protein DM01DRAFT_1408524 [Hesseltinella vesiculosa]